MGTPLWRRRRASTGSGDGHDYRDCFYASQEDRHHAAQDCPRFPCRVYAEGHADGHSTGHAQGYSAGYAHGYNAGYAAAAGQDG
jgi:hypothetical protein